MAHFQSSQIDSAAAILPNLSGPGILELKKLQLPVDVERGFFHLVDTGQIDAADSIFRQTTGI
jgi:hypothetical protein